MKSRLYAPEDYATVKGWFVKHGGMSPGEGVLPKCGVVAEDEAGHLRACAWIYQDNSVGVAWLAWLVTNPQQLPRVSEDALRTVLGGAEAICKELNYGLIFSMTNRPSLARWLKKQGFSANHQGMTQFFKLLN